MLGKNKVSSRSGAGGGESCWKKQPISLMFRKNGNLVVFRFLVSGQRLLGKAARILGLQVLLKGEAI